MNKYKKGDVVLFRTVIWGVKCELIGRVTAHRSQFAWISDPTYNYNIRFEDENGHSVSRWIEENQIVRLASGKWKDPMCTCGANHTDFPNNHYPWCKTQE